MESDEDARRARNRKSAVQLGLGGLALLFGGGFALVLLPFHVGYMGVMAAGLLLIVAGYGRIR